MPNITLSPAPFIKPKQIIVAPGASLNEIVTHILTDVGVPNICRENEVVVEVDGEYIAKAEWETMRPAENMQVNVYMPIRGGGGGGKTILRVIIGIALVALTVYTGGATSELLVGYGMSLTAATIVGGLVGGLVGFAGTMLLNAIAPIRPPKQSKTIDPPAYTISGARNQLSPYQPVPVVLGTHRFFPPLAAKPYTELVGQDEYIRVLLAWVGPCKIEDIKIGETPIAEYPGFETDGGSSIEVREGWSSDAPITLVPSVVNQTRVDVKLTSADGWVDRTMAAGYDELSIEIAFQNGLTRMNKAGKRKSVTVEYNVRYREHGTIDWIYLDAPITYSSASFALADLSRGAWSIYATNGGAVEIHSGVSQRIGSTRLAEFGWDGSVVSLLSNLSVADKTGLFTSEDGTDVSVTSGTLKHDISAFTVTANTSSLLRRSFSGQVDRTKSYDVGLLRVTPDTTDPNKVADEFYWTVFRGTKNDPPLNFPIPMAQIAVRIKASEGAQNQIDIINCVVSSYAPRYVTGSWETDVIATTSNPAALFRGVLMHPANKSARSAFQIDDDGLGDWYDLCATEGYAFNRIYDSVSSVWDVLADVAFAGRAAPALPYGTWSADFDQTARTVKAHVTPRNSWGFRSEKQLIIHPHAFKVIFNNEDKEYLEDEVIVYDDGYDSSNATVIERLEFKGITNSDLAWKFGRYHIAQARLRPETYTVMMDFEHLTFRRNDLVMVSHDVPRWGDNWARVKSVETAGDDTLGVVLDDYVDMEVGQTYAARFRLSDSTSLVLSCENFEIRSNVLTFTVAIPTVDGPQVDDLCMFNVADNTAVELICLNIRRQHDMVAEVSFVDHAPAIYDADTGVIPPFDSKITGRLLPLFLETPTIREARGELYADDYISGKINQRIVLVGDLPPVNYATSNRLIVVRYRLNDPIEGYLSDWSEVTFKSEPIAFDVPKEGRYEVMVKMTATVQGLPGYYGLAESPWSDAVNVDVNAIVDIGLPAPTNITGFYQMDANGLVSRVKLRFSVDIADSVPSHLAFMFSVQEEPRNIGTVVDHGTYLTVSDVNELNSGTFEVLTGSSAGYIKTTTSADPYPPIDLSGFFWATIDGINYRKATGSDSTGFYFAEPFATTPTPGDTLTWVELAWADERGEDFRLLNLIDSGGNTEVALWTSIYQSGGEYRIAVTREQEGTSQVTAISAQYYPAPGAGTETTMIPASSFLEVEDRVFEGSSDASISIPPGSWCAATLSTYVIEGMRVIRSPIVPIITWVPL
jgi:sulfur carrier protein ThiS